VFVLIAVIVVGTLIVLGMGISAYFAYLTEGSEPNRCNALVSVNEWCLEEYVSPKSHVSAGEKVRRKRAKNGL
jgi:hypothetical protein